MLTISIEMLIMLIMYQYKLNTHCIVFLYYPAKPVLGVYSYSNQY